MHLSLRRKADHEESKEYEKAIQDRLEADDAMRDEDIDFSEKFRNSALISLQER